MATKNVRCLFNPANGLGFEWTPTLAKRRGFKEYNGDPNNPPRRRLEAQAQAEGEMAVVELDPAALSPPPESEAVENHSGSGLDTQGADESDTPPSVADSINALSTKEDALKFGEQMGVSLDGRMSLQNMRAKLLQVVEV